MSYLSEQAAIRAQVNDTKLDLSYVTLEYALRKMGGHNLQPLERDTLPHQELIYRGGRALTDRIFKWSFGKSTTFEASQLVKIIAKKASLEPEEAAKLLNDYNGHDNQFVIPLSKEQRVVGTHPRTPAVNGSPASEDWGSYVFAKPK